MNDYPFIYSSSIDDSFPLGSYLPEHRPGLIQAWLEDQLSPHSLILNPFSSSPQAVLEAAMAGFRLIVPVHNPILRFLLESQAKPISREKLNTALVRLASSSKSGERIEPLILSLYRTDCPQCGGSTIARSFIWSREINEPVKKICRCSNCGDDSVGDVDSADINEAKKYREDSPAHARALTRVSAPDDPIRFQVEVALRSYPSRSVYALFTLFNKLSGLVEDSEEKTYLEMLLLHAFYRSSSPETRIKAEKNNDSEKEDHYIEENIWFLMEDALEIWSWGKSEIPVTYWPELPPDTGGICIYPDRIRDLIPLISDLPLDSVYYSFPRPRLSFWALSALWTGWLWGQGAAAPLRSILSIREYDWLWLAKAVETTLNEIRANLPTHIKFLGSLPELDPEYLITSAYSSSQAGLDLEYLTIEPELKISLSAWNPQQVLEVQDSTKNRREIIRNEGVNFLTNTGEPAHTLKLYGASLAGLFENGNLRKTDPAADLKIELPQIIKDFEENIAYRQGYLHYENSENWWHQDLNLKPIPLSAQVEMSLVNFLVKHPGSLSEQEIYQHIYQSFPALYTPSDSLIRILLESYGEKLSQNPNSWKLKESDHPSKRSSDLKDIESILSKLGNALGFSVEVNGSSKNIIHLKWGTEITSHYNFYISVSGLVEKIIDTYKDPQPNAWIVLPGSRAGLIYYKIQNNPVLDKTIKEHFDLVKFRHIRRLKEQGGLTHTNIQERLALDPFTSDSPQLQLI